MTVMMPLMVLMMVTKIMAKGDEDDDGNDDAEDNDSPVQVSVDDGLGEVVQVLHALGHINGYDELGLQINDPVHLNIVTNSLQSH